MNTKLQNRRLDEAAMLRKMCIQQTTEWMDDVISTLERGVQDLRSRKQAFLASTDPKIADAQRQLGKPINQLSYFVNDYTNVTRNLRMDMVPNLAAALTVSKVSS